LKAYFEFLFTGKAQETIAKLGFRPVNAEILEKYSGRFPKRDLFPVTLIARIGTTRSRNSSPTMASLTRC
jgi:sulfate/thiosulfate transport system substrate-binding protein